jgi:hypothetical protein
MWKSPLSTLNPPVSGMVICRGGTGDMLKAERILTVYVSVFTAAGEVFFFGSLANTDIGVKVAAAPIRADCFKKSRRLCIMDESLIGMNNRKTKVMK